MRRYQKRNRAGIVKERWIMAISSVFVLAALTLTGVYVRDINKKSDDGYVVDFSTMENSAQANVEEIAGDRLTESKLEETVPSDDLDFDPYFQEANSSQIENYQPASEIPESVKEQIGQADILPETEAAPEIATATPKVQKEIASNNLEVGEAVLAAEQVPDTTENIPAISTSMQSALTFKEGDNLIWPITGNVLINYSMDKTIYFPTLQQYKYNPAIIIQAAEGEIISAAAAGKVISVYNDPQIGNALIMELGSGYEVTYGQLANILVSEGSYVAAGDVIGEVAAPTKYYCVEGSNVYFKLTKDGNPVNPMTKLN